MKGGNLTFSSLVNFAQSATETLHEFDPSDDLEGRISSMALDTVLYAAIALFVLVFISSIVKDRLPRLKLPIFILMAISMAGSVMVLIGSTVYLNTNSDSGGPIHWHADFEFWACGNQLELRDPQGMLTNKIGTAVLHEHNDQRIHLEGVVVEKSIDASLGKFLFVIGGGITNSSLELPINSEPNKWFEEDVDGDGPNDVNPALVANYIFDRGEKGMMAEFKDGQTCGEELADVQTYVYHYDEANEVYWQEKLSVPETYSIFENPNVPPGNCIIVEFGPTKDRTDKLCAQYGVRDIELCEIFGVEASKRRICTIREVGMVTEDGQIIELEELQETQPNKVPDLEESEEESDA